jgi:hypothetical protein
MIISTLLLSACHSSNTDRIFTKEGDIFFDDAFKRLSPNEMKRLKANNPKDVRGFFFQGKNESCIVFISVNNNLILHGPDPVFCYDLESNKFNRRM